ncbi:MAG: hypothetical protein KC468_09450 [Myxococcales bacterium]|nr:hypothetical protein [Myxococcales bacterium]
MRAAAPLRLALLVTASVVPPTTACRGDAPQRAAAQPDATMNVHYLEVVTPAVDSTCALFESVHGLSFGPREASLGLARVARRPDGALVGIRAPLAEHERPTTRAYLAVDDIDAAAKAAEGRGAIVAYPPTRQGDHGVFAIVIQDGVEHGLWQR